MAVIIAEPREHYSLTTIDQTPILHLSADGRLRVNSEDIAEQFEKDHKHALRDIDSLRDSIEEIHGPDLGDVMFQGLDRPHPTVPGQFDRRFEMDRDGFSLLVMGWTGERPL